MIDWDLVLSPCMATFGEPVTFMPRNGACQAITAIYDEHAKVDTLRDGMSEIADRTTLDCQASQFTGNLPVENDEFEIRGVTYRAAEVTPDGKGLIAIHVMLASDGQANIPQTPGWG